MMVKFNDLGEWLQELEEDSRDPGLVKRDVVRVTYRKHTSAQLPICSISVVAGYQNEAGELVELVERVGEVMPGCGDQDPVCQKATGLVAKIRAKAQELHLTVRAGAYAEA